MLIRGMLLAVLAAVGYAAWWAQDWVSPENVRAAVENKIQNTFPTAQVTVGTARMRLLGGISVTEISVTKPGDTAPLFMAATAVIYHEKEQLNSGRLVVRKIDLEAPVIRLERKADGTWNFSGLAKDDKEPDQPMPTLIAQNATLHFVDHTSAFPSLTLSHARFQVMNDPLPIIIVEANGTIAFTASGGDGPPWEVAASLSVKLNRNTKQASVRVDVPDLIVNPALANAINKFHPGVADLLEKVTATVGVKLDLNYTPSAPTPLKSDVKLDIKQAKYADPALPWPLENITGQVRFVEGRLKVEKASATFGPSRVDLALETREESAEPVIAEDVFSLLEDRLQSLTMSARNLPLSDEFFSRMPDRAQRMKTMFSPKGNIDLTYKFTRPGKGWRRDIDVRPNRLSMTYEKFKYPVTDLAGSLRKTMASDGTDELSIQITGHAGGRKVDLTGRVAGAGEDPFIDVRISADDIAIDERLIEAIPSEKHRLALKRLRAEGRGNVVATIRQGLNQNRTDSVFTVTVTDAKLNYEVFPYPLEKVRGDVVISLSSSASDRPPAGGQATPTDRFELVNFTAKHGTGQLLLSGSNERIANSPDRRMTLAIKGKNCPMDDALRQALAGIRAGKIWQMFDPKGAITFGIDCTILDRANTPGQPALPFDSAKDLKMTVNFKGPTITPDFFSYELAEVSGVVRYQNNTIDLVNFAAHHGNSQWALSAGEVRLYPDGATWVNLGGISAIPLVTDATFMAALPKGLKEGLTELALKGPADLHVRHMVIAVPADQPDTAAKANPGVVARAQAPSAAPPTPDPTIYWDAKLTLMGASFDTGLPWESVHGTLGCIGRYESTHLGAVVGNIWLERAFVAGQPLAKLQTRMTVEPQRADPSKPQVYEPIAIQFHDAAGTLFHGFVGGEAHVVLTEPTRYRLWLTASDVRLDEVAKHYKLSKDAELKGVAQARIILENQPDAKTGELRLRGEGSVDVPAGRMYNLPVLLDLVKLAKFQAPDQTAFEEGHAVFKIVGDRIKIEHLDLIGSAVSLGGSGEVDSSGKYVKLEFYTIWSQTLKRWLTTPLGDITALVSDKLFRIEMTRAPDGTLKYDPRLVPAVTDPVRAVAERLRRRSATTEQVLSTRAAPTR